MKNLALAAILTLGITGVSSAEEVTYTKQIKPLFDKQCAGCHGPDAAPEHGAFKAAKEAWIAKGKGPRMDTYSHLVAYTGWPDTGAIMRRLDDGKNAKSGKPGNMYQHLGATEEERQQNLALFKAWVGVWSLKKLPELTKEELSGIKVAY